MLPFMPELLLILPSPREYIFVIGGPGAGKGTQCSLLAKKYGFWHFSLGNILRAEASIPDSRWGDTIRRNMQEGAVGSKEMMVELLRNAIGSVLVMCDLRYILIDGFPRNLNRAELFEETIAAPLCVLHLHCPDSTLRQRLHLRAETEGRTDDNDRAIDHRIATLHHNSTTEVLDYYARRGTLVDVEASVSQLEVLVDIERGLGKYLHLVPGGSSDRERSQIVMKKGERGA